jgi:hypothetical protein
MWRDNMWLEYIFCLPANLNTPIRLIDKVNGKVERATKNKGYMKVNIYS